MSLTLWLMPFSFLFYSKFKNQHENFKEGSKFMSSDPLKKYALLFFFSWERTNPLLKLNNSWQIRLFKKEAKRQKVLHLQNIKVSLKKKEFLNNTGWIMLEILSYVISFTFINKPRYSMKNLTYRNPDQKDTTNKTYFNFHYLILNANWLVHS